MANERSPDRGNLFENTQKKKPSQWDLQGDCTIDGVAYEIRGWRREEQMTVTLAWPRGDRNTYPPDVFRGALDPAPAPTRPARPGGRGPHAVNDAPAVAVPAWAGDITSDDATYTLRAFEKQGKSGTYFTLSFARLERSVGPGPDAPADD